ncbi:MAG TPA: membrane dipeptidase [Gammaproteobacteria bacterium]|nr:membrane dipeptidase [Gammaproteobacteria bacterium]
MLEHSDRYTIVKNVEQILTCALNNKLGIAFDIEGSNLLNGKLDMVSSFYELGAKQLVAYNVNNASGGGCLGEDIGLNKFREASCARVQ